MLSLYHNGISTCSQKVRLVLETKGLDWESRHIDLLAGENRSEEYLRINPKGLVPVLLHGDDRVFESSVIVEYLDDAFSEEPVRPAGALERARMRGWMRRVDDELHMTIGIVSYASVIRSMQLQRPREEVLEELNATPDPMQRALKLAVFESGVEAPQFALAVQRTLAFLGELSRGLAESGWLAGDHFSLAEACVIPYVTRLKQLGLGFLLDQGDLATVKEWTARYEALPAYEAAVGKWIPEPALGLLKQGGAVAVDKVQQIIAGGS